MVYIQYDFKCSNVLISFQIKNKLKNRIIDAEKNRIQTTALELHLYSLNMTLMWFYIRIYFIFVQFLYFLQVFSFIKLIRCMNELLCIGLARKYVLMYLINCISCLEVKRIQNAKMLINGQIKGD